VSDLKQVLNVAQGTDLSSTASSKTVSFVFRYRFLIVYCISLKFCYFCVVTFCLLLLASDRWKILTHLLICATIYDHAQPSAYVLTYVYGIVGAMWKNSTL